MTSTAVLPRTWLAPREVITVTRDALQAFGRNRTDRMAAALAYFTFFSLFPLLLLLLAILGFLLDMEQVQDSDLVIRARTSLVSMTKDSLPGSGDLVEGVIKNVQAGRGASGLIGALGLLWSASTTFNQLHAALDQIWGLKGVVAFGLTVRRRAMSIVFVLGLFILLLASQILKTTTFLLVNQTDQLLPGVAKIYSTVTWFFPLVVAIVAFGAIYRAFPSISVSWYEVWPGAVLAGIGWELLKWLFAIYAIDIANWQAVYGPIASVIALLTFLFLSFVVLLFGAEFSAAYSRCLFARVEVAGAAEGQALDDFDALDPQLVEEPAAKSKERSWRSNLTGGTVAGMLGALTVAGLGVGLLVGRVRRLGTDEGKDDSANGSG